MMISRITYHGTFVLTVHNRNHALYFVKYNLCAYFGALGATLFLENPHRTDSVTRRHLASLFDERFIDFKRRAQILKPSDAPAFINNVYLTIAQDMMTQRLAA